MRLSMPAVSVEAENRPGCTEVIAPAAGNRFGEIQRILDVLVVAQSTIYSESIAIRLVQH